MIKGARAEAAANDCLVAVLQGDPVCERRQLDFLTARPLVGVIYTTLITQAVNPPERLRSLHTVLLNATPPASGTPQSFRATWQALLALPHLYWKPVTGVTSVKMVEIPV
ncbi:MAG: hypothetical protein H0T41_02430 [Rhodobacteraceae bacterium]|nr:hypothetical protein [Paracoccaceae bacterium]